jgi:hypothetical protein
MRSDAELRRQALELAIKCDPAAAVERAEKFLVFLSGGAHPRVWPDPDRKPRWPKIGDIVIFCGPGFTAAPAIVTNSFEEPETISLYVFGSGGAWPIKKVERGCWRFRDE